VDEPVTQGPRHRKVDTTLGGRIAFAHLAIAIAFIGPYIDPVRNKWVITFGLIAC
jgi:hypothetical protein